MSNHLSVATSIEAFQEAREAVSPAILKQGIAERDAIDLLSEPRTSHYAPDIRRWLNRTVRANEWETLAKSSTFSLPTAGHVEVVELMPKLVASSPCMSPPCAIRISGGGLTDDLEFLARAQQPAKGDKNNG